jgi:hypothetical protein
LLDQPLSHVESVAARTDRSSRARLTW